jgi:hypothetical protein
MHFATFDLQRVGEDGVNWCANILETRKSLPAELKAEQFGSRPTIFTLDVLERHFPKFWRYQGSQFEPEFVIFFEPPSLDPRIVNQVALFSFTSRPDTILGDWLAEKSLLWQAEDHSANPDGAKGPPLFRKIVIPSEMKWEIRDKLDQALINERVLFPGLDGLSTWLKRWYSHKNPLATPTDPRPELIPASERHGIS